MCQWEQVRYGPYHWVFIKGVRMKKICVLILLVISCLACNSLDDWTTKDVLNDGGTDSDTSTALVNKDTAPWADNCMEQLDAWIAGNALPGDGCYWGNGSSSCSRGDYGELFCVDNRMRVMCPEGEWMNFDEMLDAVSDRCFWQITGTVPTDSDMPVVWTDCSAESVGRPTGKWSVSPWPG